MVDASAVDDMVRTVFEGQDVDVDEETKARTGLVRREIRRVKARVVGDTFIVVAALNNNEFIIIPSLPMPANDEPAKISSNSSDREKSKLIDDSLQFEQQIFCIFCISILFVCT